MILAVNQPNYIPWKGYFDMIHDVDLFVFYNDVQYTAHDWRNRNKIKTQNGLKWLTVPVGEGIHRLICDVIIQDKSWQKRHYDTIKFAYSKAPYFKKYQPFLEDVYLGHEWDYLYELDQYMIEHIAKDFLGIKTAFADSRDYPTHGAKNEKLLSLLSVILRGGGAEYMSPAQQQKIISLRRIMSLRGLNLSGKITKDILSIRNYLVNLHIRFLFLTCCLTSAMTPHIISGDGEKARRSVPGSRLSRGIAFLQALVWGWGGAK